MEGCSVPRDPCVQALRELYGCDGCSLDNPHPDRLACCAPIGGPVISKDRQSCLVRRDRAWGERNARRILQD